MESTTNNEKKKIAELLNNELQECKNLIIEFDTLFPNNELQYELYDEISHSFFYMLNKLMFDFLILKIIKLLDPISSRIGGIEYQNLSLHQLSRITENFPAEVTGFIQLEINDLKMECSTMQAARNKCLGHNDLDTRLNATNFGTIDINKIKNIVNKMCDLSERALALINKKYSQQMVIRNFNCSTGLINALKQVTYYRTILDNEKFYNDIDLIETNSKYNGLDNPQTYY